MFSPSCELVGKTSRTYRAPAFLPSRFQACGITWCPSKPLYFCRHAQTLFLPGCAYCTYSLLLIGKVYLAAGHENSLYMKFAKSCCSIFEGFVALLWPDLEACAGRFIAPRNLPRHQPPLRRILCDAHTAPTRPSRVSGRAHKPGVRKIAQPRHTSLCYTLQHRLCR